MKIAILLPYKENFSPEYPGAVSLFVNETSKLSKYKKDILVFGNTNFKKKYNLKYLNISLIKNPLISQTKEYVRKFSRIQKKYDISLIEVHNRPSYILQLKNIIPDKIFSLYFHNDPLSMNGSKTIEDRLFMLKNVEKIIFVSQWVKDRFFLNLDLKLSAKTEIVYPSVNKQKATKKYK